MRIDHGPGYRIYYAQLGRTIVVLLCGVDKKQPEATFWSPSAWLRI
ncbi:hypothetical protein [Rhizobium sp. TRM95796]|nr:hypothetical protein [Rhizobium sp. TRM95796]